MADEEAAAGHTLAQSHSSEPAMIGLAGLTARRSPFGGSKTLRPLRLCHIYDAGGGGWEQKSDAARAGKLRRDDGADSAVRKLRPKEP